jgi:hypothetical protein
MALFAKTNLRGASSKDIEMGKSKTDFMKSNRPEDKNVKKEEGYLGSLK